MCCVKLDQGYALVVSMIDLIWTSKMMPTAELGLRQNFVHPSLIGRVSGDGNHTKGENSTRATH